MPSTGQKTEKQCRQHVRKQIKMTVKAANMKLLFSHRSDRQLSRALHTKSYILFNLRRTRYFSMHVLDKVAMCTDSQILAAIPICPSSW